MVGADDVERLVGALIPPDGNDGKGMRRWRVTVALLLGGVILGSAFHIAYACGWLTTFGLSGFAQADVVAQNNASMERKFEGLARSQKNNTNEIMATVISGQILGMYATECSAKRSGNIGLAGSISDQLSTLQVQYSRYSGGQFFPLQPCP